jgi:hypothetical protein
VQAEQRHLWQFLLYVFVLLIPSFVLWTAISDRLQVPAVGLVDLALTHWFPGVVHGLWPDGYNALLMTEFGEKNGQPVPLTEASHQLGFRVNPRILTYSLPFYTALYFATPRENYLANYLWGLLLLYGVAVFGLLSLCLKELMVNLGGLFLNQQGVFVPHTNVIGILYQFNVLILPTLAPAVVWLWQSRDQPLLQDLLPIR